MCASDPLEVFVAEFVEKDVGSYNVHEHLHMHAVSRDVAALRGAQHTRGVPVRQLLRTEPLVHVPIRLHAYSVTDREEDSKRGYNKGFNSYKQNCSICNYCSYQIGRGSFSEAH